MVVPRSRRLGVRELVLRLAASVAREKIKLTTHRALVRVMALAPLAAPLLRAGGAALPGLAAAAGSSWDDGGPSFLQLPAAPQLFDGMPARIANARPCAVTPRRPIAGIKFNTQMGGGGSASLFSAWHAISEVHVIGSLIWLLAHLILFFFPYRVLFFQGGL